MFFGIQLLGVGECSPGGSTLCPTIRAESTAAPTTVELMAFPARSCRSRGDSLVSRSLFTGRPCSARASSPHRGPPLVVIYGIPAGVMQPTMPNARLSTSRSTPWESSMHLLWHPLAGLLLFSKGGTALLFEVHVVSLNQLPQEVDINCIPDSFGQVSEPRLPRKVQHLASAGILRLAYRPFKSEFLG